MIKRFPGKLGVAQVVFVLSMRQLARKFDEVWQYVKGEVRPL